MQRRQSTNHGRQGRGSRHGVEHDPSLGLAEHLRSAEFVADPHGIRDLSNNANQEAPVTIQIPSAAYRTCIAPLQRFRHGLPERPHPRKQAGTPCQRASCGGSHTLRPPALRHPAGGTDVLIPIDRTGSGTALLTPCTPQLAGADRHQTFLRMISARHLEHHPRPTIRYPSPHGCNPARGYLGSYPEYALPDPDLEKITNLTYTPDQRVGCLQCVESVRPQLTGPQESRRQASGPPTGSRLQGGCPLPIRGTAAVQTRAHSPKGNTD